MHKFAPILKRVINRAVIEQTITQEQANQAMEVLKKRKLKRQIEQKVREKAETDTEVSITYIDDPENPEGLRDINWSSLFDWLLKNLPTIIAIILSFI